MLPTKAEPSYGSQTNGGAQGNSLRPEDVSALPPRLSKVVVCPVQSGPRRATPRHATPRHAQPRPARRMGCQSTHSAPDTCSHTGQSRTVKDPAGARRGSTTRLWERGWGWGRRSLGVKEVYVRQWTVRSQRRAPPRPASLTVASPEQEEGTEVQPPVALQLLHGPHPIH